MKEIFEFFFPGLMLMWVCFIAQNVFSDVISEYKAHTIARALTTGTSLWQVLLSKILRCFIICWLCELLLMLFTGIVFGVGWKDPLRLFVVLSAYNVFVVGFLAMIYGYAKTPDLANAIVVFTFMISAVIGGIFMPFNNLPKALQQVGQWTMMRLGGSGLESIFKNRPLWEVMRPSLLLTATGLFMIVGGMRILRKRFELGKVT